MQLCLFSTRDAPGITGHVDKKCFSEVAHRAAVYFFNQFLDV